MNFRVFYFLLAVGVLGYIFMGNSSGRALAANDGNTGAPGEGGLTCASCHNGGAFGTLSEVLEIRDAGGNLVTEYIPGNTYTLTLAVSASMGTPAGYGFQMTELEDAGNTNSGTWQNLGANVQTANAGNVGGRVYIEHGNGTSASGTFTAEWVAPAAGTGSVTFYYTGNAVDGTGGTANDLGGSGSSMSLMEGSAAPSVCGTQFLDSGGTLAGYSAAENITTTLCPDNPGDVVTVTFTYVDIEASATGTGSQDGCWDYLTLYNGDSNASPVLAQTLCGQESGAGGTPSVPASNLAVGTSFMSTDATGCLTFVFLSDGVIEMTGWVADVTCAPPPACPAPSDLVLDGVTDVSAIVSWTENGTATSWDAELVDITAGGTPTGTPTATGVMNPYTVTGLTQQNDYEMYVRADCGVDGPSTWIGPLPFTTACSPVVAPYMQNFDNGGVIPTCWTMAGLEDWLFADGTLAEPGHGGNAGAIVDHTSGTGYFAWINDSGPHNLGTSLLSPLVDVSGLTAPSLSFWLNSDNEGFTNVDFSVDIWDGAAWNTGAFTSSANTNGWLEVYVNLGNFTITGPVQARFVVDENNGTDFYDDVAIDDVKFDELPGCVDPSNFVASNATTNSIDLAWMENGIATTWEIEIVDITAGGTATGDPTVSGVTNPYTAMGLAANNDYQFYVRSECGVNGLSAWVGPVSMTTLCNPVVAPYSENFDNGGAIPTCWTLGGGEDWLFADGTQAEPGHGGNAGAIADHTSGTGFFAWINDSSPHSLGSALMTPLIDVSGLTTPGLSFWIYSDNEGFTNVDFSVDFWDGAAWNTAVYTSNTNTNGWKQVFVDLSGYTITGPVQIRFVVDENNGTDFYDDIALDDVLIDELPNCLPPTDLAVANITSSSADLSWTVGGTETNWNVEIVEAGATPGAGFGTMDNPFSATGLMPQTDYEFYVKGNCGPANLIISGAYDGPLTGGLPKGIELFVINDISDLSKYGVGSANNGGGTDGQEYTFPADAVTAGSYIYVSADSAGFNSFFGFNADYITTSMGINGDDAIELFENGVVIDVFGDINMDGTGTAWDHLDGWAYRNGGESPNMGTFADANWTFSGINQLEGGLTNATCLASFPMGSFTGPATSISPCAGPFPFTTLCLPVVGDSLNDPIIVPALPYTATGNNEACYSDQYLGRTGNDIFYQFTTGPCANGVIISTCDALSTFDTYLYLLDATGAVVATNDDASTCTPSGLLSTIDQAVMANTTYYAVVEGFNDGAFGDFVLTITEQNAVIDPVATVTDIACNGEMNGSIALAPTGGVAPYSYMWSNGTTTASITGLAAGDYFGTVTDANGCSATSGAITIAEPSALALALDGTTDVTCNGASDGSISVSIAGGSTPYTFAWSNGSTTEDLTGLAGGTYMGTITDANGCILTSTAVTINEPSALALALDGTMDVTCNGAADGSISISIVGGTLPLTYAWSNGSTTEDLTGLSGGSYTGTITDANGCVLVSPTVTILEPMAIALALDGTTDVTCNGAADGSISITVTGGTFPFTYAWSNGATTEDLVGLAAGDYTGTITDGNGCVLVSPMVTINEPSAVALALDGTTNVSCNGGADGSISITVTGGTAPYTYAWSNGATTEDLVGLVAGSYVGTITDANGCMLVSAAVMITEPSALALTLDGTTDASCNGGNDGTISISVVGGSGSYTYAWSNGATTEDLVGLAAGNYTGTITDANGCTLASSMITINEPSAIQISLDGTTDASCNGGNDGSISISVVGGSGSYTYAWSNGSAMEDLVGLAAGDYTGTITDANGCMMASPVITINEPSAIAMTLDAATDITCNGAADGTISISVVGGTGSYSYAWSNGATTEDLVGLAAGDYTGTITDANGCTFVSGVVTIVEPAVVGLTLDGVTDASCAGASDGIIMITPTGGTAPYTYAWSNGATTEDLVNIPAGDYIGTITDANGCTAVSPTVTVNGPATGITVSTINTTDIACNGDSDGTIDLEVTGGATPYTYAWSNGATSQDIAGLAAGTYLCTISDAVGCSLEVPAITITEPATAVSVSATVSPETGAGNDGSVSLAATGGTAPYSYAWDNGAITSSIGGLAAGTYCVTVMDANACQISTCEVVGNTVAVNTIEELETINLFPNPTANESALNLTFTKSVDLNVEVINTLGQVLWNKNANNVLTAQYTLDLTTYPVGIYFVRINVNDKIAVKRLVVTR